jgi:ribosome-associated toxin RatA of RatAB toxin-antitoxin module
MLIYEYRIIVNAQPHRVWNLLSDVTRWPQWLPTVTHVEALDGEPIVVGARYRVQQPKLRPAVWTVTEVEDSRRFVWEAYLTGIRMVAEHDIVDKAQGVSEFILRYSFGGLLGGVVGRIYRPIVTQYLAQEATALKQAVERSSAPATPGCEGLSHVEP